MGASSRRQALVKAIPNGKMSVPEMKVEDTDRQKASRARKSKRRQQSEYQQMLVAERQERATAARDKYAALDAGERRYAACVAIQKVYRTYKSRKLLLVLLACMRVAQRWTPTMIFRLYTSLEAQVKIERQAKILWENDLQVGTTSAENDLALGSTRNVFDNALTEEGFLGLARDLDLLKLPHASHSGFGSLFRRHTCYMTDQSAFRSRAKGLFAYLCKSSPAKLLGKEELAKLLTGLGLPRVSDEEAMRYTFANGTWDVDAFLRYLQDIGKISNPAKDDQATAKNGATSQSPVGNDDPDFSAATSTSGSDDQSWFDSDSGQSISTSSREGESTAAQGLLGMKIDGFEEAMKEFACVVRPAGESCECVACSDYRDHQSEQPAHDLEPSDVGANLQRIQRTHEMQVEHTGWAVVRLYHEVLAPAAATLFNTKACASRSVFGAALISSFARKKLSDSDKMLREIFLTLVGRQGDRDRDAGIIATTDEDGAGDVHDSNAVLKAMRAECRMNGFDHAWAQHVVAGQGNVGYFEVLRFCWDYGLYPNIPNSGENNFLLAHLFVGALHTSVSSAQFEAFPIFYELLRLETRIVPDEESNNHDDSSREGSPKLRALVTEADVDRWLADRKLERLWQSEDSALAKKVSELSVGGGKISAVKIQQLLPNFNTGLHRPFTPGELYNAVHEMGRFMRAAEMGESVTARAFLHSVAHTCVLTRTVTEGRLTYGHFTSFVSALSQLQPGLSPSSRRAALQGFGAQPVAGIGQCMRSLMANLESVHPKLSKEGIRSEVKKDSRASEGSRPSTPRKPSNTSKPSTNRLRGRARAIMIATRIKRRSTKLSKANKHRNLISPAAVDDTNASSNADGEDVKQQSRAAHGRTSASWGRENGREWVSSRTNTQALLPIRHGQAARATGMSNVAPKPARESATPAGQRSSSRVGNNIEQCGRSKSPSSGIAVGSPVETESSDCSDTNDEEIGPVISSSSPRRRAFEKFTPVRDVLGELNQVLRIAFARYAALEPAGFGLVLSSEDKRDAGDGDGTHGQSASDELRRTHDGGAPNGLVGVGNEASTGDRHSSTELRATASSSSPGASTSSGTTSIMSIDGLLLFVSDTNVFPRLNFELIKATAAAETMKANRLAGGLIVGGKTEAVATLPGLSADAFVTVCLQLERDNFLAKELGFQHRVEAMTSEQRNREWARRGPAEEHDDLLRRLRGWLEHYRLPTRMAAFKRDAFTIFCPTESRGREERAAVGHRVTISQSRPVNPRPGPCLIDLWTGQVVARSPDDGSKKGAGPVPKVDDRAERAIMQNIGVMVSDRAAVVDVEPAPVSAAGDAIVSSGSAEHCAANDAANLTVVPVQPSSVVPTSTSPRGDHDVAVDGQGLHVERVAQDGVTIGDHTNRTAKRGHASSAVVISGKMNSSVSDGKGIEHSSGKSDRNVSESEGPTEEPPGGNAEQDSGEDEDASASDDRGTNDDHEAGATRNELPRLEEQMTSEDRGNRKVDGRERLTKDGWKGDITAREVAKKARSHRLKVSNVVGEILGQIRSTNKAPVSTVQSNENRQSEDGTDEDKDQGDQSDRSGTSSENTNTEQYRKASMAAADFTVLPSTHPSRQLFKAGVKLIRLKRPEQAAVLLGKSAEILRNICEADPRQRLVTLLQLSSVLTTLERYRGVPQLLAEAADVVRLMAERKRFARPSVGRSLEARVTWKLGWAYIAIHKYERALQAFQQVEQLVDPQSARYGDVAIFWGAKGGAVAALVGLKRGREAISEAAVAIDSAIQMSEPAVRAESEGLLGRAWRSTASQSSEEANRQETERGFAALAQLNEDIPPETRSECLASKANAVVHQDYGNTNGQTIAALNVNDNKECLRQAASCFRRQVALLGTLDRLSAPLPVLDPQVDLVDDGDLGQMRKGRARDLETSTHVASLRALLELGQTAMDLEQFDVAVSVFERRLRLADTEAASVLRLPRGTVLRSECLEGLGSASLLPSSTKKPRSLDPTCLSGTSGDPGTGPAEEDCTTRQRKAMLDVAETLWWLSKAHCQLYVGVNLAQYPRFLPFSVNVRLHPAGNKRVSRSAVAPTAWRNDGEMTTRPTEVKNSGTVQRTSTTAPSRLQSLSFDRLTYRAEESVRPAAVTSRPPFRVGRKNGPRCIGWAGRNSARRRRPRGASTADAHTNSGQSESPWAKESLVAVQDVSEARFVVDEVDEEVDSLLAGTRIWRDSSVSAFTKVMYAMTEGPEKAVVDTCGPIMAHLRRQLASIGTPIETQSPLWTRQETARRDAFFALGVLSALNGNTAESHALFEQASQCSRSLGDWTGVARAHSAKARLNMCTGRAGDATTSWELVLKLSREVQDSSLLASAWSFLGWAVASQGETKKALHCFRQWRKLAHLMLDAASVACAEVCLGDIHLRAARASIAASQTSSHRARRNPIHSTEQIAGLTEARRHYQRYLRWAIAIEDARGISHANMCLARVCEVSGEKDKLSFHVTNSLKGCRLTGDISSHGKIQAREHEEIIRRMLELSS